jgi:hypothetical protein
MESAQNVPSADRTASHARQSDAAERFYWPSSGGVQGATGVVISVGES